MLGARYSLRFRNTSSLIIERLRTVAPPVCGSSTTLSSPHIVVAALPVRSFGLVAHGFRQRSVDAIRVVTKGTRVQLSTPYLSQLGSSTRAYPSHA